MHRLALFFFSFIFLQRLCAQQVDVLHYKYQLALTDASDTLKGTATITVEFLENTNGLYFNLASIKGGKGMQVYRVASHDTTFSNIHVRDTLFIQLPDSAKKNTVRMFDITYAGIPKDGLIISKNKWGDRTFFGDNWPNRAHQWLPCNDQPDDKATTEFEVTAPASYKVISNGILVEEKNLGNNQRLTHWRETVPISTKVMVIGAARFAVKKFADSSVTPVSAWVYPQDSTKGFYDYEPATSIIKFFSGYVGPYPFEKLANVQSTTIFGGMENASCIFYDEKTVTGTRQSEALLAHEIAHQWFGNSATEKSFAHLWLSEGFATYFAHLYLEQTYGRDTLVKRLQQDRKQVLAFSKQWPFAVVDSTSALMDLLNANSYEKGGWILHMLRQYVGDTVFHNIIRAYYNSYKFSNADTWDFEKVAEDVSGKNLKLFFQQWLFTPSVPHLAVTWHWNNGQLSITVQQLQKQAFSFPLTIGVHED
jgi:aminopeptidase N